MLSIGKLGQGQGDYYLETVAQGAEDYYTGSGEAPGHWLGSAARSLGVGGQVGGDALRAALDGAHPRSGSPLVVRNGGLRVPGFDLTFSAPKSVSVLFGLTDSAMSWQVAEAHETAVRGALDYMERTAAVARRGHGGTEQVPGNGFLAAAFRHRTSRAGDPQLHTHVLVANMTRGPDGRWTALDARHLYAHAKTAGYLYQAQLRAELVRRLGVEWTPVRRGTAEIAGLEPQVLRHFSRRRAEIDQAMSHRGDRSPKAAQIATLDTRRGKDYAVSPESLADRWRGRASMLELDQERLAALTDRFMPRANELPAQDAVVDQLASPEGLTRSRSTFTRRDVVQAWCDRLPQGADIATTEGLVDAFLDSRAAVPLAQDVQGLTHGDVIRRADGRVVPATAEERRYSTPELLTVERRLVDGALDRQGDHVAVVPDGAVDAALRRRPTLGTDQAQMVRRLTQDGHGVQLVTGRAGAGKTFALDAAREAWESQGHRVIGAAVARRAACELQDGAGIPSTSLAALLQDLRAGERLAHGGIVVVDEASMAATRQLDELLHHAHHADAKVVLVGDDRQLPEIDAGGAFRALLGRTNAIELTENRRQDKAWEREALNHLREGRPEEAIERYERHGRVVLAEGAEDVRGRLVADWWQSASSGEAVMIALRRDDVADLNRRARGLMQAAGHLGEETVELAGRDFAVGDHVVALRNDRRQGVVNGTRGVINSVDAQKGELTLRTADGRDVSLSASYLQAATGDVGRTLDHGYAITGHKAQGMTTDRAFVLGTDDLYREWGYVAMSRGRQENRLYVVAPGGHERDEYAPPEERRHPLRPVLASLRRSEAQTSALDVAARTWIASMSTTELLYEQARLAERLGRQTDRQFERVTEQRAQGQHSPERATSHPLESQQHRHRWRRHRRETSTADRALQAQARERARQLAEREADHWGGADGDRDPEAVARHAALGEELDRRRRRMARTVAHTRPDHLLTELGPHPDRPSERRLWETGAVRINWYREEFNVDDPASGLGPEPPRGQQRSAWRDARRDVETARRQLGRTREAGRVAGRDLT